MGGVTYSDFKEGDRCWIVVGDVNSRRFFEGQFQEYLPDSSRITQELRMKVLNPRARGARAVITDARALEIEPRYGFCCRQEPACNYAILPKTTDLDIVVDGFNRLQYMLAAERHDRVVERQTLAELLSQRRPKQPRKV